MSPLEKAARAIYEARTKRHGFTVSWEQAGIVDQDRARHDARAVIEAIIEPSQAMEVEGGIKCENMMFADDPDYSGVIFKDMGHVWREMARALLAEGEGR